ncbi:MAG: phosphatase PAP2 family protein [Lachnospiraceae bacterium]|nr:phosphatase PAP2 family protein [Lachnospiraceae bacterium]
MQGDILMNAILEWDASVLLWIQENMRTDLMTTIMKAITRLGDGGCLWIVLAIVLLVLNKTRKVGAASALALIITFVTVNLGIKNAVARIRPYEVIDGLTNLVGKQSDFSFPSGHSAHAFAVGVVILIMMPKKIGVPIFAISILMAFSRLYVGVHYPTDVIAGVVLGTIIAFLSVTIINKICQLWNKRNKAIEEEEKQEEALQDM